MYFYHIAAIAAIVEAASLWEEKLTHFEADSGLQRGHHRLQ